MTVVEELENRLSAIQMLVDEQAKDEALWCKPKHIMEDYLQQHLRRLHEVIEGKTGAEVAIGLLYD